MQPEEIFREYAHRRWIRLVTTLGFIAFMVLWLLFVMANRYSVPEWIALGGFFGPGVLTIILLLLYWRCPACEKPLGREQYAHCPHCGTRLIP